MVLLPHWSDKKHKQHKTIFGIPVFNIDRYECMWPALMREKAHGKAKTGRTGYNMFMYALIKLIMNVNGMLSY